MQNPLGKLFAIGGAEDKGIEPDKGEMSRNNLNFFELGILRRIVQEAGGSEVRIEVITTASMIPNEVGENYLNAFGKIGCTDIGLIPIRTRADAMETEY
ncbi:MAG: cyanophycinase, partial [Ginsengibacter sp.]